MQRCGTGRMFMFPRVPSPHSPASVGGAYIALPAMYAAAGRLLDIKVTGIQQARLKCKGGRTGVRFQVSGVGRRKERE